MDSPSIAEAVARATPDVRGQLDRHAKWCARMCRNVPPPTRAMFQNVPSGSETGAPQTARMFPNVPESSAMFHPDESDKTNPTPPGLARPLTYRQLATARLIVRGRGSLEVARQVGVEHHSVARWKRDPAFRAELERLRSLKTNAAVTTPAPPRRAAARPLRQPVAALPPIHRTKEDSEHEAMIEAYMRQHGL